MKQNVINRRNFLRITATAGAVLFTEKTMAAETPIQSVSQDQIEMPVRTLGRTNIQLPILSMGVMRADNQNVLRAAFNSGIKHFDTAHGYQGGKNEEMVGSFFAGKPRDSYIIATKVKFKYPLSGDFENEFMKQVDISLNRLKMDYVDIFYIHAIDNVETIKDERVISALKKIKDAGKAKFLGISTHANKPEQLNAAVEMGLYDVILLSYNFKMNKLEKTNTAIEHAAKAGIGFIAMKTMAGGVEDAGGKKKINAQACLKWVWRNKHIATIIPGFTNYDELDECLTAVKSMELNDEETKYLASLRNKELLYCQQCGQCSKQCPEHLPIPDMMRAYMYTYGYKYAQLSKETLLELKLPENICDNCKGICKVACSSGFNVGQKIAAIKPVVEIPDAFLT
jgi:aryl-alcohol dehydrogenase-like predicted oxidoreductase